MLFLIIIIIIAQKHLKYNIFSRLYAATWTWISFTLLMLMIIGLECEAKAPIISCMYQ